VPIEARTPPHNDAIEYVSRAGEITKYLRLEQVEEGRKLVSGALQEPKYMVEEAQQAAGMSAQQDHKAQDDYPADGSAHG